MSRYAVHMLGTQGEVQEDMRSRLTHQRLKAG